MSAYIVSKKHIDYLITAGLRYESHGSPLRWLLPAPLPADCFERGVAIPAASIEHYQRHKRELTTATANRVGCLLWAENYRSVNDRYDENNLEHEVYEYDLRSLHGLKIDPVQVLKAIDCYEYQSCEHAGWKESEAYAFCQSLRREAIRHLPGYGTAQWEID